MPIDTALVFINWNSAELVVAAWKSAVATTGEAVNLRPVVVDNGSEDDSVAVLRREIPRALIIEHGENRGFAAAVNTGLRSVHEPFALILNADITFHDHAVERLVQELQADPKSVLACPRLWRPDGSLQAAAVPEPRVFWELTNRSLPRRFLRLHEHAVTVVPGVVGPCMAVKMEGVRQVGLMDERFFFFFEETDWCKRMTDSGWHVLYVPQAEVVHLQGETANRRPFRARVQFYESRYRFFAKHSGMVKTTLLFLGIFLRLSLNTLLYGLLALLTGGRAKYRDKLAVAKHLWRWHLRGCPAGWSFQPVKES